MASYEQWVEWVFDRPVGGPPPLNTEPSEFDTLPASTEIDFFIRLFERPQLELGYFSDAEINQGFWLLAYNSDGLRALHREEIPWEPRRRCIESFATLYRELFAARCTPHLSHTVRYAGGEPPGMSALNSACYMWWDFDCWCAVPNDVPHRKVDAAFLEVMREALSLPHLACQESALHGLGHWHRAYPEETGEIIGKFLEDQGQIQEDLRTYARSALTGCIL